MSMDTLWDHPACPDTITVAASALNDTSPSPTHTNDPETSVVAAVAAGLRAPSQRRRVLLALVAAGVRGCTDYELGESLNIVRTSAGKRRLELRELGLCRLSGVRRPTDTTTPAVVHEVTELGQQVAAELRKQEAE